MTTLPPQSYPLRQIKSWTRRETRLNPIEEDFLQESPGYLRSLNDLILHARENLIARKPIFIDIGCGDGQSTIQLAQWAPEACIIGIETHTPGIAKGLMIAHAQGVRNLSIFQGDFWELLDAQPDLNFDRIHLYFSDPWPKSRHHKRRLIQVKFLEALRAYISTSTILHIATDWANYAEYIMAVLLQCPWLSFTNKHNPLTMGMEFVRTPTKYERRGLAKGHSISEFYIQLKRADQL
jgi:tRNA (guanine-N7-)-methyltransferase